MHFKIFLLLSFCLFSQSHSNAETHHHLNFFSEVFRYIRSESVRPASDEALIENAVQGMLSSLDDHSMYITPAKYQEILNSLKGGFDGIGIEFTLMDGKVIIVSPIDDTPASKAGLMAGDEILEIEGDSINGLLLPEIRDRIKGQIGEPLSLKIRRKNEILEFQLQRSKINIKALKWSLSDKILFVRISHFDEKIGSRLQRLLKKQSPKIKGVVLDLRNNPGGILEEALDVTNAFLSKGKIISVKTRRSKNDRTYYASSKKVALPSLPLVILINGGTASSAEIVAAALKDHNRATLIGEKSFGKGSVQTILPIPPGYAAIQLTTGLYYTPSGLSLDKQGIQPHLLEKDKSDSTSDSLKEKAIQILSEKIAL